VFARILSKVITVLAVALVLAAPATADSWGRDAYASRQTPGPANVRPDDRAGIRGVGPLPTVQVTTTKSSFNWGDAAIGGAAVTGVMLLGLGLALIAYRRRARFAH
jgi:hypothetical protein